MGPLSAPLEAGSNASLSKRGVNCIKWVESVTAGEAPHQASRLEPAKREVALPGHAA